jgi:acyl-coenzyme A thioesterase PaaI-like protein
MTVTDVLAGSLVGRVLYPDWMATAELALHLGDRPPVSGDLVVDADVVRDGRTTVVLDARLRAGVPDGAEVGQVVLTFVRLPRRDTNLDLGSRPVEYGVRSGFGAGDLSVPWTTAIGAAPAPDDATRWRLPVVPYVLNSFGAVNGGVVASLAAACGAGAAAAALGVPTGPVDVVVHYLSQGRVGPIVAGATVVRAGPGGVACRVEVSDSGVSDGQRGDGRSVAVAHVLSCPGSLHG